MGGIVKQKAMKIFSFFAVLFFLSGCAQTDERAIVTQAIATGAVIGGVVGGVVGNKAIGGTEGTIIGAAIGSAFGGITGKIIGDAQLAEINDLQLQNEDLEKLLKAADDYNKEIAYQNKYISLQISSLKKQKDKARLEAVGAELEKAKKQQNEVGKRIKEREKLVEIFAPDQKKKYEKTLKKLEAENTKLTESIKILENMHRGHIG